MICCSSCGSSSTNRHASPGCARPRWNAPACGRRRLRRSSANATAPRDAVFRAPDPPPGAGGLGLRRSGPAPRGHREPGGGVRGAGPRAQPLRRRATGRALHRLGQLSRGRGGRRRRSRGLPRGTRALGGATRDRARHRRDLALQLARLPAERLSADHERRLRPRARPCGLRTWQGLARSEALEPTLALAQRAKALGVAVFFISGRPSKLREATETNLRAHGFEWDDLTILPDGASFPSAVDFKAPARRRITENGYTILVNVGDQDSDLAGGYAERTFKLPNPVYYLP